MAAESFENESIAKILNDNFIPIKIDREERPDVDRVYMDFLQATTGGGGWPLNVFVTPDLEPIFGGTYWPGPGSEREGRHGAGFAQILNKVAEAWTEQEERCRESARQITSQLKEFAQEGTLAQRGSQEGADAADEGPELELLEEAYEHYKDRFDSKFGGFGGAPKFPTPVHLVFLLRLAEWDSVVADVIGPDESKNAREMALKTLEHMAKGGMKDQVATGFARYSVTRDWSLPHFEKMLYDNSQLLPLYLDAYLLTKHPLFHSITHDIATYLTTEPIHSKTGGFHASEDADSMPTAYDEEHKEGAFYVWTADEFRKAIDDEKAAKICAEYWNVREGGNVNPRHDPSGELEDKNNLSVVKEPSDLAKQFNVSEDEVLQTIAKARSSLLAYRNEHRPRPHLDDKIVVSWNGLAIGGLARTAAALQYEEPDKAAQYLSSAEKAAAFVKRELYNPEDQTLRRVYREGPGDTPAFADDYAFLISGLIDLYEATFDDQYLQWAEELQRTQLRLFFDESQAGFFSTAAGALDILIRSKDAMDNAEPSTNGVSAHNLFRLASLFDDEGYEKLAKRTVKAFEVELGQHPGLLTGLMNAVVMSRLGVRGIMVSGPGKTESGEGVDEAVRRLRTMVRPGSTVMRVGGGARSEWLRGRNGLLRDLDGSRDMVQVCEGGSCRLVKPGEVNKVFKGEDKA